MEVKELYFFEYLKFKDCLLNLGIIKGHIIDIQYSYPEDETIYQLVNEPIILFNDMRIDLVNEKSSPKDSHVKVIVQLDKKPTKPQLFKIFVKLIVNSDTTT